MPNARKNRTKMKGSVILSIEMAVFLDRTKPALLLVIKMESSIEDRVRKRVKTMKAAANKGLSLMKPKAGDQRSTPITNANAIKRDVVPVIVRPEFISSAGFSDLLRNRIKAISNPRLLSVTSRPMQVIIVEARPTSASL
jgi:hypothetical protein